ncbi:MAG: hypothetical protein KatS3mg105_0549 [Gemmatales bacterium]|nr:MAG: hypothetical protein KatS3mg105_0549 [Gemmatales bacterium]
MNRQQTIQDLAQKLRALERTFKQASGDQLLSTGIEAFDALLPAKGIPRGTLLEWLAAGPGSGAGTLACSVASRILCQLDGACVVVDPAQSFYPPAAGRLADDLERMIVIHPSNERDTWWALEQALRCPAVAVVLGWPDRLLDHAYRRLQLAVETGGGIGLLLRSEEYRWQPSWADIRLRIEPLPSLSQSRRLRVEVVQCRGRFSQQTVELEINDETGDVHLASALAPATAPSRPTTA